MPTHLRITAKRAGFRRAGRAWPDTPTEVAVADFSAEQLEQLAAEPMLIVQPFDGGEPAADAEEPAPKDDGKPPAKELAPQGGAKPPAKPARKAGATKGAGSLAGG